LNIHIARSDCTGLPLWQHAHAHGLRSASDELQRLLAASQRAGWRGRGDESGVIVAGFSKGCLVISALLKEAAEARRVQAACGLQHAVHSYTFIDPGTSQPNMLFPFNAEELSYIKTFSVKVYASAYQMCDLR
jgi:hypothetical protein